MALEDQFKEEDIEDLDQRFAAVQAEADRFNANRKKPFDWTEDVDDWFKFNDGIGYH